jgi:protein-tyrosine phosphatase/GNAT superfamily N-acetyltransferase
MEQGAKTAALKRALAVIKLKKGDGDPVRIAEGIFIGSIGAAHNVCGLKKAGITHVLSMSTSSGAKFPDDFVYKTVVIDDKPGRRIVAHFRECFAFIDAGKVDGGVLVHCFQGKSRSAAVILGYQMHTTKLPFIELLDRMRVMRPSAQPNPGFAAQLLAFQRNKCDLNWTDGTVGIRLAVELAKAKVEPSQAAEEESQCEKQPLSKNAKKKKKQKAKKAAQASARSGDTATEGGSNISIEGTQAGAPMCTCAGCGVEKGKDEYSKRQWSLKVAQRLCKQCVAATQPENVGTPDSGACRELIVQQLNPDKYLKPAGRTEQWWAAYQAAFLKEHEWMEGKGQSTSRGMGLNAARMAPLVFKDEAGSKLKRVCFFASYGAAADAVGYATVDVDSNPAQVCHVRMVLVTPENQRQGIGLALLMAVTNHFSKRHLGLKFARCHDYERFYSKAGFMHLGNDDLYAYMALKRK